MSTDKPAGRGRTALPSLVTLAVLLAGMLGAYLYGQHRTAQGLGTALEETAKKSRLVGEMQVSLLAAAEAEKSAVMAETDEASEAFAADSRRASAVVERDRLEVARLIELGGPARAQAKAQEFGVCWERHQALDREILGLAVENTNLKAQKLSFGAASAALDHMEKALDELVAATQTSADAASIARSSYAAMSAARKIHSLEGPHIVDARDPEMDRIEREMKALETKVDEAVGVLAGTAGEPGKPSVDAVRGSFAEFQGIHKQVLALSRKNSNVRSLAMSIGEKRKVTAECQALLGALREAVGEGSTPATR